jgi:hypothetical protein
MKESEGVKEWETTEELPPEFVDWLNFNIRIMMFERRMSYREIVDELGVPWSLLDRWLVGAGPLAQSAITALGTSFGAKVYSTLGLQPPQPSSKSPEWRSNPNSLAPRSRSKILKIRL